jgi:outer membrane protein
MENSQMPHLLKRHSTALCSASLLALVSLQAHAEGPEDRATYGFDLGIGGMVRPAYEGSDDEKLRAMPLVRGFYNTQIGRFSLGENGLTWSIPLYSFEVGASLGFDRGRKESASPDLAGLGDISRSTTGGLFGIYRRGPLDLRISGKSTLTSNNRSSATMDLGAGYHFKLSDRWILTPGVSATWANAHYMQRYFGVTDEQSYNSGLPEFHAESGWKNAGVGLNVMYRLSKSWGVMADVRQNVLLGDAADSPITRKKNQTSGMLGISYHWQDQ